MTSTRVLPLDAEPTLDELDKFRSLVVVVISSGKDLLVPCSDEREAKLLRRRFYRLREQLVAYERDLADQVSFSCLGHRVRCSRRNDWTQRKLEVIGVPNDSSPTGDVPPSDRLNDKE